MLSRCGFVSCALCAATGLVAASVEADAQGQPGFTRTILQKTEYPGDKHVCLLMVVEIAPNAVIARHTHPGVEAGYLVSGVSTLSIKGQPDRDLKPGDGYQLPPEMPHSVRNGAEASRFVVTFIMVNRRGCSAKATWLPTEAPLSQLRKARSD